jgi:hypothetical protein
MIAVAALALAGCGSVTAAQTVSGSAAAASGPLLPASHRLCTRPAAASRVVVARTDVLLGILPPVPGHPFHPIARPAKGAIHPIHGSKTTVLKVVTSPSRTRTLARALCALPKMPRTPMSCPALFAGSYQLSFTAAGRKLPVVTIQQSGCQLVTGLGAVRRADSPAFWALLAKIAGPIPVRPVHLPGSPVNPGGPILPVNPGPQGCSPPTSGAMPHTQAHPCPGQVSPAGT